MLFNILKNQVKKYKKLALEKNGYGFCYKKYLKYFNN